VPTFADRGCHVVSVTDLYCRILGFLDLSRYFSFQAAPQLRKIKTKLALTYISRMIIVRLPNVMLNYEPR
jgi:hypothetical protein